MKLYKFDRVIGMGHSRYQKATLQDLRQAVKEFGCVVVPSSFNGFIDALEKHIEEKADIRLSHLVLIHKAMLKAAEAADE